MNTRHDGKRAMWPSVLNGIRCRCPRCGKGKLFRKYLKIAETCSECGLHLGKARADDFPPYIAITIVGHIIVMAIMHFEMTTPLHPIVYMLTMLPAAIIMSLAILPSTKGAVVGVQWATGMHGFSADPA